MAKIKIHYNGRTPEIIESEEVVSGQLKTIEIQFTFSEEWDMYANRTAVFTSSAGTREWPLNEEGTVRIPRTVICSGVRAMAVSVFGVAQDENGEYKRYNGKLAGFRVEMGGRVPGEGCKDADPSMYEVLLTAIAKKLDAYQGTENAGKAMVVGEDGTVVPGEAKGSGDGLSSTEKNIILSLFKNAAYTTNMSATIAQLETLWGGGDIPDVPVEPDIPDTPTVTLASISATYSGGAVAVGTALTALTGIVVTATYSDGSTAAVTGYTLSGTIAEGSNTITVSYGGKTATITVTGVAEPEEVLYEHFDKKNLVDTSGSNSFITVDGVEYYRYHAGANNFEYPISNPQPGEVIVTMRAIPQYATTLDTGIWLYYNDGTEYKINLITGGQSKGTVTYTTPADKTLTKLTGNYDMENWVLLDMSVMSLLAKYPPAEPEVSGVLQNGDILSVVSGVTITQSGSILEIA